MIRLLIVEDDIGWLKSMSIFLAKEEDIIITGTASGREMAVEAARVRSPDVILMDINLNGNRYDGIVLAKSIPSKKFDIQTGEPVIQAKQKCPGLIVVPPNYFLYMKCSSAMIEIFKEYCDQIQVFSIDEYGVRTNLLLQFTITFSFNIF